MGYASASYTQKLCQVYRNPTKAGHRKAWRKIEQRRPKMSPSGLRMTSHVRSLRHGNCLFFAVKAAELPSTLTRNSANHLCLEPGFARLGTDTDNRDSESECTEEQGKSARRRKIRRS